MLSTQDKEFDRMHIRVLSRNQFESFVMKNHKDGRESIVISICSYGETEPFIIKTQFNRIINYIVVRFNDTDSKDIESGGITPEIASSIAKFTQNNYKSKETQIIVHCGAGQSRSAGIAAALLKHYIGDDTEIFNSSKYTPNMICYRLVLEELVKLEEG